MCQLLARDYADVNACDNRGVSCVMAAFRKGNIKVVKWLVKHVSQFPADADCKRFMATISDKVHKLIDDYDAILIFLPILVLRF